MYVKVWVYDSGLKRVQTRWVLFGTYVPRWYGRDPMEVYAHDLLWDRERALANFANSHQDFYFFSGDQGHLKPLDLAYYRVAIDIDINALPINADGTTNQIRHTKLRGH